MRSPPPVSISKRTSLATGTPSGRFATPRIIQTGSLSSPNTSRNNSEAPSATFGYGLADRRLGHIQVARSLAISFPLHNSSEVAQVP